MGQGKNGTGKEWDREEMGQGKNGTRKKGTRNNGTGKKRDREKLVQEIWVPEKNRYSGKMGTWEILVQRKMRNMGKKEQRKYEDG